MSNVSGLTRGSLGLTNAWSPSGPKARTFAQIIADRAVELAAGGDIAAKKEVIDRTDGRGRQKVDAMVTNEASNSDVLLHGVPTKAHTLFLR